MKTTIDLTGWDKAEVLARLHHKNYGRGMPTERPTLTVADARKMLEHSNRFDYMGVDLSGDELDPTEYDRNNYPGAAASALKRLYGWYSEKQRIVLEHMCGKAGAVCYLTPDDRAVMVTCVSPTIEHGMGFDDVVFVSEVTRMADRKVKP